MSIRFIIGRAGAGKTHWCVERTVEMMRAHPVGTPIIMLLPRQATFQMERRLTCDPRLDGFIRTRILSFEELGREALTACGGGALGTLDAKGRQMVLRRLLRELENELEYFGPVARQAG